MGDPKVAVVSFPGNNCEVESLRALKRNGIEPVFFRWNDDQEKLAGVDGYFLPGGFSYEDRGRSGMVAARDPLMELLGREADEGKVIIGNCNGAQILVESGLIPLGKGLQMSLARNAVRTDHAWEAPGFLNEWVWITRPCSRDRCATSDWAGVIHLPIAHGEGRFTTKDPEVTAALRENDQIAFSYCDAEGRVSMDPVVTPNGSFEAIAGICNPAGNVVAIMPHPERTTNGDPYFRSLRQWIVEGVRGTQKIQKTQRTQKKTASEWVVGVRAPRPVEIFIDTVIVNNEERTVEQAARRVHPDVRLKQYRYLAPAGKFAHEILTTIALFNPNKERAFIRREGKFTRWNHERKREETEISQPLRGIALLRCDEPDTGGESESGVCYVLEGVREEYLKDHTLLEIFANPHASTLERMQ